MARDLCLCAGETQPSLQQLGKQEAGREALAAENLTESQGEAAEPQAWHLGGLRRWVREWLHDRLAGRNIPRFYRNLIRGHRCHPEDQPVPGRCVCV